MPGREHISRRSLGDRGPVWAEQKGVMGDAPGLGEVVEHEDDAKSFACKILKQANRVHGMAGVEGREGLIGQEDRAWGWGCRSAELGEGAGNGDALLLACGEVVIRPLGQGRKINCFKGLRNDVRPRLLGVSPHLDDPSDREGEGERGALRDKGEAPGSGP